MSNPERSFARIDTALKGYLRILPDGRLIPLFSCTKACSMSSMLTDSTQSDLPDTLLQFLGIMDEKLNTILGLLNRQTLSDDFPIPILIHDISGAGLRFNSELEFELGTAVEVVIALGSHTQVLAGAIGHVIRRDDCNGLVLWAMGFKDMRDSEREKIIQYVVAQQREQLRERRLTSTP